MSVTAIAILAVLGVIAAIALLFLLIGFVLSVLGGWRALAATYRAVAPPAGMPRAVRYGRVGVVNYNSALTAYVSSAGLYLRAIVLFRPSHPDLFVPWQAVVERRPARVLFFEAVELVVGQPRIATILLPKQILDGAPV